MKILDIYRIDYEEYSMLVDGASKYEWAANNVFNLCTYDSQLDELFMRKIIEVLKAIISGVTFEYIKDETNYVSYIIVCQMLDRFKWINWGTSIRGAWIDTYHPGQNTEPILTIYMNNEYKKIPCTKENLIALIGFIEE